MLSTTKAIEQDLAEVFTLLKLVDLPVEGVKEHFNNFFVVKKEKTIVGCVGIEIYENVGLLRSVALHPSFQGKGIGQQMVNKMEAYSVENRLDRIYLLTDTAESFFLKFQGKKLILGSSNQLNLKRYVHLHLF
ncbi:MAG: GNAT family N-acetyltransferase [Candidatus Hodarchaeales archaeon]|jgi:amino-acid N-acetyltransferase